MAGHSWAMNDSVDQYLDGLYDICAEQAVNVELQREIINAVNVARASPAAPLHLAAGANPREGKDLVRGATCEGRPRAC